MTHKYDGESTNKTANEQTAGSDGAMELKSITILLKQAVDSVTQYENNKFSSFLTRKSTFTLHVFISEARIRL